ncbi:tetratricopeptide repeat protein [Acuticoccus kandeliae]|uniref:tetratricopeptide repeat protein n=1 Tax=Acuticoccus kandeliae TaxID=2073160 RepID=UPI000D3EDA3C|nr:tetratricopeptide repeat protein [Acuticoccus kandeliae]
MYFRSDPPVPSSLAHADTAWCEFVSAFMAHSATIPERVKALSVAAPASASVMAAKGLVFLLLGRREAAEDARALSRAADAALDPSDPHERLLVTALREWVAGRPSQAAAACDAILEHYPADGFAMKMAQAIRFLYGDSQGMLRSAASAIGAFGSDHPHAGYASGCFAFASEEFGDYAGAEAAGRRALELAPDDAWALHAVAHVHEMRGHAEKGRQWLADRGAVFAGCNNFRNHVWWHYALFELELGNIERVLALYDAEIRREQTDDYRDIANAVSLLARLEADGIDVGPRWDELSVHAERRIDDACIVFADLHYLLALLSTGRHAAADRLIERLAHSGDGSEFGAVAVEAGRPTAGGLAALARGRHDEALRGLLGARAMLKRIGGSHAQRDVFERLTIEAALRAGRAEQARALIEERAERRGAWDRFGLERLVRCGARHIDGPPAIAPAF